MTNTLDSIGIKFNTDKSSVYHNYLNTYERYLGKLRFNKLSIMEIGIFNGASLKMWEEYFSESNIFASDIENKSMFNSTRIQTFIADQGNRERMKEVMLQIGNIDILIEDGSHRMDHQQISLGLLFPFLTSGGIYIVEDLHSSRLKRYKHKYNPTNTKNTTINILREYILSKKMTSDFMTEEEKKYLEDNIKECIIEKCNKSDVAILTKKD